MDNGKIYLGAFFIAVCIIFYMLFFLNPDAKECYTNPLGYQAEKISKNSGENYSCSCQKGGGDSFGGEIINLTRIDGYYP